MVMFPLFSVLETFTSCADQTAFGFCGETVYLEICDPRGRERNLYFDSKIFEKLDCLSAVHFRVSLS